eukprot:TRINITY_DN7547_c0_g1_i1.p1 TRINITY_DN7547_c0_g1~~TRINITY_DN7547_c0_g1_i1.p1  ORF type:complete len:239 (+),score=12.81 TRINITY_DN7547_c0_g1_i1:57-773(+)
MLSLLHLTQGLKIGGSNVILNILPRRWATKKSVSSTQNNRGSIGKRLGAKVTGYQVVKPSDIILRQRGQKCRAGSNVRLGRDHTLTSKIHGRVYFYKIDKNPALPREAKWRRFVAVLPLDADASFMRQEKQDRQEEYDTFRRLIRQHVSRSAAMKVLKNLRLQQRARQELQHRLLLEQFPLLKKQLEVQRQHIDRYLKELAHRQQTTPLERYHESLLEVNEPDEIDITKDYAYTFSTA